MYSSTFIFAKRQYDDAFHRLDQEIAAVAKSIPGYLGEETWENPANGLVSNVYYWETLEALQVLMKAPAVRIPSVGHETSASPARKRSLVSRRSIETTNRRCQPPSTGVFSMFRSTAPS